MSGAPRVRWWRLARKELRETLRDRRTLVTLLLMPLLVYPLLSLGLQQFLLSSVSTVGKIRFRVGAIDEQVVSQFQALLIKGDALLKQNAASDNASSSSAPEENTPEGTAANAPPNPVAIIDPDSTISITDIDWFQSPTEEALLRSIEELTVDLGVLRTTGDKPKFVLKYRNETPLSRRLAAYVEERLQAANTAALRERLAMLGGATDDPIAFELSAMEVEGSSGFQLAGIIPLILVLMTITGAVYPAIDLTAGERERGTLESLMAAPVPRFRLLAAKYVAVVTVAMLTAAINLLAMTVTLSSTGLATSLVGPDGITITLILQLLALLVLFAAFFSALLLTLTSFARSFKEAQAYLIPLMLAALGPGFMSLMPGMELEGLLTITPLANMVLLARDVLSGDAQPLAAMVAIISTLLYAVAALAVAARIFGSDAILYGSSGSWSDLLARPAQLRPVATISAAALSVAIVYPIYFVSSGLVQLFRERPMVEQLAASGIITLLVFGLVPWGLAKFSSVRVFSGFQLRWSNPLVWIAAFLLGISLWPLAIQLMLTTRVWGAQTLSEEQLGQFAERLAAGVAEWRSLPVWVIILAVAISPGVGEEWFFRGYLLGACRDRISPWLAIGATSLAFGLFHLSVGGLIAGERVLASTLLGAVLGCVAWRTRSVLPGMLIHATHNGIVLSMAYYQKELEAAKVLTEGPSDFLPASWIVVSLVVSLAGAGLLWLSTRSVPQELPSASSALPATTEGV